MTRILQIRRGTATQNNKFTGMAGELSFDTENKTLRVHDGQTLGGFELARTDKITTGDNGGAAFDINSVPSEFWQNIIKTYSKTGFQISESILCPVPNGNYLEYIFDINSSAKFANAFMVCQVPEAGYSIGDVVSAFGIGARTNPMPNTFTDSDGLHIRLMAASEKFWVNHKNTAVQTNITNANWKIKFSVCY